MSCEVQRPSEKLAGRITAASVKNGFSLPFFYPCSMLFFSSQEVTLADRPLPPE